MVILFEDEKFAKECNNLRLLQRQHGKVRARRILQRLADLAGADTLEDMRNAPGRCHELHGDRAGQLSMDLDHPYRLLFRPGATARKPDGGLDWTRLRAVIVIGVADTHE